MSFLSPFDRVIFHLYAISSFLRSRAQITKAALFFPSLTVSNLERYFQGFAIRNSPSLVRTLTARRARRPVFLGLPRQGMILLGPRTAPPSTLPFVPRLPAPAFFNQVSSLGALFA